MSNGWWANKIQQAQPQVHGLRVQPQAPVQAQPIQQQGHPLQHAPVPPPQELGKISYQQIAKEHDGEKISKFWQGGEGVRTEGHMACPQCGSSTSFTAYSGAGGMAASIGGNRPRPHCFECGYNGLFIQGDQANWA